MAMSNRHECNHMPNAGKQPHTPPLPLRMGPPVRYVPVLQSLADHQRNPMQFPLGYVREDEEPAARGQERMIAVVGRADNTTQGG